MFLKLVTNELKELPAPSHGTTHNVTKGELEALTALEKHKQSTVKPSDRGGNIIIMDTTTYWEMCWNILR